MKNSWIYPVVTVAVVLLLWESAAWFFRIPQFLLPRPTQIFAEMFSSWQLLYKHSLVTGLEVIAGFALSVAVGIPLAVTIVYSPFFEKSIYPLLVASQAIPKIAIAPLFVVWFGFGFMPKMIVSFLVAFFPVVIDTVLGMRSVPPEMLHLGRSLGASPLQMFIKIRLPKALPNIFGGMKIAVTLAVVGAIVGEFIGANEGLGYLLLVANGNLNTKLLFADVLVQSLMAVIFFMLIELIERKVTPGHESRKIEELQTTI